MTKMNRRQKLAQKWMFKTDDVFTPVWLERWVKLDEFVCTVIYNWPCWLLKSHYAISDQCNKPAHDYCAWCQKSMPNQAERIS